MILIVTELHTSFICDTGLGFEGDVVKVPRKLARGHMLLTKVARYASEENLRKTAALREVSPCAFDRFVA